jgi:hypothetical protein
MAPRRSARRSKRTKTTKKLERLALDIVRRMQGCEHVEGVTVAFHNGWHISTGKPGFADNSDVRRAILIAEPDLDRFELAWLYAGATLRPLAFLAVQPILLIGQSAPGGFHPH